MRTAAGVFLAINFGIFSYGCSTAPAQGGGPGTASVEVEATLPTLPASPDTAPSMDVQVGCSATEERTPIATVAWRGDRLRSASTQRLDTTVYKEGFEQGEYATVPLATGGTFAYRAGALRASERSAERAFALFATPVREEMRTLRDGELALAVAVEVRRLEPGVTYWWRVATRSSAGWTPSGVVEVQAPICVFDEIRED